MIIFVTIQIILYLILIKIKCFTLNLAGVKDNALKNRLFLISLLTCLPAPFLLLYGESFGYTTKIELPVDFISCYVVTVVMIIIDGVFMKKISKDKSLPAFKLSFAANSLYYITIIFVWGAVTGALFW